MKVASAPFADCSMKIRSPPDVDVAIFILVAVEGARAPDQHATSGEESNAVDRKAVGIRDIQLRLVAVGEADGDVRDARRAGLDAGRRFPDASIPVDPRIKAGNGGRGRQRPRPAPHRDQPGEIGGAITAPPGGKRDTGAEIVDQGERGGAGPARRVAAAMHVDDRETVAERGRLRDHRPGECVIVVARQAQCVRRDEQGHLLLADQLQCRDIMGQIIVFDRRHPGLAAAIRIEERDRVPQAERPVRCGPAELRFIIHEARNWRGRSANLGGRAADQGGHRGRNRHDLLGHWRSPGFRQA